MYCRELPLVLTLQGQLGQPDMGHHTKSPTHSSCSDPESILGAWLTSELFIEELNNFKESRYMRGAGRGTVTGTVEGAGVRVHVG